MALHDWAGVPDSVFHSLHVAWLGQLMGSLNRDLLPEGYIARAEDYALPFEADVLTLDVSGREEGERPARRSSATLTPTLVVAPGRHRIRRQRRITILTARGERRVALLEIVSPGNKDARRKAAAFRDKVVECLQAGLHVLVVDIVPGSPSAPNLVGSVARALGSAEDLEGDGRSATSFESAVDPWEVSIYHAPLGTGKPLPTAPLFLEPGFHVGVPLERTYMDAFGCLAAPDRALLAPG